MGVLTSMARPKSIKQLRAQLALLGIAASNQNEARGMAYAQTLALDDIHARSRDVQQEVDEMVLKQVCLVDIKKSAICLGQQSGLEAFLAIRQRAFEIKRADDAILGGAEREVDDWRRAQG